MDRDAEATKLQAATEMRGRGQLADAAALYREVLQANPASTDALQGLGFIAFRSGRFDEAERLIAQALAIAPESAEMWNNRGSILGALKRREDARACFDRALQLRPDFSGARANRANALLASGHYDTAARDYEALLAHEPDWPYARGNLVYCRLQTCDWRKIAEEWRAAEAALAAGKRAVPPVLSAALLNSASLQRRAAEILAAEKFPPAPALWRREAYAHKRLRIAYLSADFHAHATATLTAGLFESHDRQRFETFAFSYGPDDGSAMRARLRAAFDQFFDVAGAGDADIAARLRAHNIDIAVDLKGYTSDSRPGILAFRPAPVQVNYLGFPGTMGTPLMDYIIADGILIPSADDKDYAEKIVRLPDSYQPNDRSRALSAPPTRAQMGLPETGFVFCCFNAAYKLTPEVFARWMRLLNAVEGSVLWLLHEGASPTKNLKREAEARGVSANRLVFAARTRPEDHLARHACADLFLDTFPYNAHTTASDALWTGLPFLTLPGASFASRVGASLLNAAGLPELIAHSAEDYESKALALARERPLLAALRAKLAVARDTTALFDIDRYTRHLERAYETMAERSRRGLPPAGFSVEAMP
jgi:predicted O-linked N-acetylglucosamine transferase (SPINDLY family)